MLNVTRTGNASDAAAGSGTGLRLAELLAGPSDGPGG